MNIYFLTGMPRSGNTILSSVLNQNPNVKISPHSLLPVLIDSVINMKKHERFINFPDFKGLDNIVDNIFENYYAHYNCENIIDRASWGHYWKIIDRLPIKGKKYIILYRPILEILASFVKIHKPEDVHYYCDELMMKDTLVTENLNSIRNILKSKKEYLLITYDDLIKDFSKTIQKICGYINIPYIRPDYTKIKQFELNGVKYDDSYLGVDFHTIETNFIKKTKDDFLKILPLGVIEKYKNFDKQIRKELNYKT